MNKIPEKEKLPCIYAAQSITTKMMYIGQSTKGLHHRRKRHRKQVCRDDDKFHLALRDLGWSDFVWDILYVVDKAMPKEDLQDLLNKKEIYYIEKFNSIKEGYNSAIGGQRTYCKFATLEEKRIEKNKRRRKRDLLRKEENNVRKNNHKKIRKAKDPEKYRYEVYMRRKNREILTGITSSEKHKIRRQNMTEEQRENNRIKQLEYKHSWSDERRAEYNKAQKQRKLQRKLNDPEGYKLKAKLRKLAREEKMKEL